MKRGIEQYCKSRCLEFSRIDDLRKNELQKLSAYLRYKKGDEVNLLIVEQNHRLIGHLVQVWLAVAANYYKYPHLSTLSAGIEKSEMETHWMHSMLNIGFDIECKDIGEISVYTFFIEENMGITCRPLSIAEITEYPASMGAMIEDKVNPEMLEFPVEITCDFAYPDPIWAEGSFKQEEVLQRLIGEIAREMLYVFSF